MKRQFSFPTVTDLVEEVKKSGVPRFSRTTFYRLVRDKAWVLPKRTQGGWRRFSEDPKEIGSIAYYVHLIRLHYGLD